MTTVTDTTEANLLRMCIDDPLSDAPRLVFADALEERGNPWSEFIRVGCELAGIPDPPPETEGDKPAAARQAWLTALRHWRKQWRDAYYRLRERERELLADYELDWLPTLPGHWRSNIGGRLGWYPYPSTIGPSPDRFIGAKFRRGFPEVIHCTAAQWVGGECRDHEPGGRWAAQSVCRTCHGTGRTPGIAEAVCRAVPVTQVVTEKRPDPHGTTAWWNKDAQHPDQPYVLPAELFDGLTGFISRWAYGDEHHDGVAFDDEGAALAALSRALVDHARDLAKLPKIEWPKEGKR